MSNQLSPQELHDRTTRGIPLSANEQTVLEAWYEDQDQTEQLMFGQTNLPNPTDTLQTQVQVALARLQTETSRIQELSKQNDLLRQEIYSLKIRLRQSLAVSVV